ncbi:EVE domain-containing protein [Candidatus Hepatincola sp. Pdp]
MSKLYWLLKSEPETWSFSQQKAKGIEKWDGVRNFQARNNLRQMQVNDLALFYHSGKEKAVVGMVKVVTEHYPDVDPNFSCVDVEYYQDILTPVTLAQMKTEASLQGMAFLRQSRLSVCALQKQEFYTILKLGNTLLKE